MMIKNKRQAWLIAAMALLAAFAYVPAAPDAVAGDAPANSPVPEPKGTGVGEDVSQPAKVDVRPTAFDGEIDERLTRILEATDWFENVNVGVRDGVVFLSGEADTTAHKEWAAQLARNTQDVVAVVNQLDVRPPDIWDFSPAWAELRKLWHQFVQSLPLVFFALLFLPAVWLLSRAVARLARPWLDRRIVSPLLSRILTQLVAIPILLLGLYIVLQVFGLTQLALTVVGGTGLLGIIVGFAFRDIAENFLASILLSMRRPFQPDDLIEVGEFRGLVQQLNTRSTVLMTEEGNHVQIPNATVYKSTLVNLTANRLSRDDFKVTVGYDHSIRQAQDIIGDILDAHPAVQDDPAPWILVNDLATSSVVIKVYFWYDIHVHSRLKIKSSLMRQILHAFEEAGISAPDDAREVIFPQGVPIVQTDPAGEQPRPLAGADHRKLTPSDESAPQNEDEGGLGSDTEILRQQADQSRNPEEGEDLLSASHQATEGQPSTR